MWPRRLFSLWSASKDLVLKLPIQVLLICRQFIYNLKSKFFSARVSHLTFLFHLHLLNKSHLITLQFQTRPGQQRKQARRRNEGKREKGKLQAADDGTSSVERHTAPHKQAKTAKEWDGETKAAAAKGGQAACSAAFRLLLTCDERIGRILNFGVQESLNLYHMDKKIGFKSRIANPEFARERIAYLTWKESSKESSRFASKYKRVHIRILL